MSVSYEIAGYIASKLTADSTLMALIAHPTGFSGIYDTDVPAGAPYPHIVFSQMSSLDDTSLHGDRMLTKALIRIEAVAQDRSYSDVAAIGDRIDVLLHQSSGTTSGGRVLQANRRSETKRAETSGGQPYRYAGGDYDFWAQSP